MSLQVFLQAQMLGAEEFLSAPSTESQDDTLDFLGRSAWLTLFCEVLPRALLAELKLSRMLLGSSSAEQFLLVLTEEDIERANQFLERAAAAVAELSGFTLRLVWVSTENLGAWPVARKRLDDALATRVSTPLAAHSDASAFFAPQSDENTAGSVAHDYFTHFANKIPAAKSVGWSREAPAQLEVDGGEHVWPLMDQPPPPDQDALVFPRRYAMDEAQIRLSSLPELGERAEGTPRWGVLRGDVDQFDTRLRRAGSIEDHIHLSILFKQFFAGELALLCMYPEFWRTVTILHRGGDDFAVAGSWDALILLARELHRLFEKFAATNLQPFAGVEAKSISMALAIAPEPETPISVVYEEAGRDLRTAKVNEAGTFHLFGRTLEWARLEDAEELKTSLTRLVKDFRANREYVNDLASVYRESFSARATRRAKSVRVEKPWRTYMRVSQVIPQGRGKEALNVRNTILTQLLGKRTTGLKLRPSARVGLEWARLAVGQ